MKISDYLQPQDVVLQLQSTSREDVIEELVETAIANEKIENDDKEEIILALKEREQKGSTGIQNGIAIPHVKSYLVQQLTVIVGVRREGLDFKAIDKKKTHIFILTLSPPSNNNHYLEFLSTICSKLKDKDFCHQILISKSADEIYELLTH